MTPAHEKLAKVFAEIYGKGYAISPNYCAGPFNWTTKKIRKSFLAKLFASGETAPKVILMSIANDKIYFFPIKLLSQEPKYDKMWEIFPNMVHDKKFENDVFEYVDQNNTLSKVHRGIGALIPQEFYNELTKMVMPKGD